MQIADPAASASYLEALGVMVCREQASVALKAVNLCLAII